VYAGLGTVLKLGTAPAVALVDRSKRDFGRPAHRTQTGDEPLRW
jgi:hypothetical protein